MVPRKMIRRMGTASRLRTRHQEAKLAYIQLNIQTPCPPRGAVPVNQGYCGRFFHSQRPDRLRSWMRPPSYVAAFDGRSPFLCQLKAKGSVLGSWYLQQPNA